MCMQYCARIFCIFCKHTWKYSNNWVCAILNSLQESFSRLLGGHSELFFACFCLLYLSLIQHCFNDVDVRALQRPVHDWSCSTVFVFTALPQCWDHCCAKKGSCWHSDTLYMVLHVGSKSVLSRSPTPVAKMQQQITKEPPPRSRDGSRSVPKDTT